MSGYTPSPEIDDGPWRVTIPNGAGTYTVGYVYVFPLLAANQIRIGSIEHWFLVTADVGATHRGWATGQTWKFTQIAHNMGSADAPKLPPANIPPVNYLQWTHQALPGGAVAS